MKYPTLNSAFEEAFPEGIPISDDIEACSWVANEHSRQVIVSPQRAPVCLNAETLFAHTISGTREASFHCLNSEVVHVRGKRQPNQLNSGWNLKADQLWQKRGKGAGLDSALVLSNTHPEFNGWIATYVRHAKKWEIKRPLDLTRLGLQPEVEWPTELNEIKTYYQRYITALVA